MYLFLRTATTAGLALLGTTGLAGAQTAFYVSPTGSDANLGIDPAMPLRTVTQAIALARTVSASFVDASVNIAPGTYSNDDPTAPESFPLDIPAFGLTIEAYGDAAPVLDGGTFLSGVFDVDRVAEAGSVAGDFLRPTRIQNLEFTNSTDPISIDPSRWNNAANTPRRTEVGIRDCEFSGIDLNGILITTQEGWTSSHIVERNTIRDDTGSAQFGNGAVGIRVFTFGESSTLMRSNRIVRVEDPIIVFGSGSSPRIVSNELSYGERLITLFEGSPYVVNNTLAYVEPRRKNSDFPDDLFGINYSGTFDAQGNQDFSSGVFANNIVWTPDFLNEYLSGGQLVQQLLPAPDLAGGLPFDATYRSDYEDYATAGIGPDANLNIGVDPQFVSATDLHLMAGSPLIDAGASGFARLVPNFVATPNSPTLLSTLDSFVSQLEIPFAGGTERVDIPIDVDGDARFAGIGLGVPTVEIGADEVDDVQLTLIPNSSNAASQADALGTVRVPPGVFTQIDVVVRLDAPAGFTGLVDITFVPDTSRFGYFHGLWGSVLIDPLAVDVFPAQAIAPGVETTLSINNASTPILAQQLWNRYMYVQALAFDPADGRIGQLTNRVRLGFDQ